MTQSRHISYHDLRMTKTLLYALAFIALGLLTAVLGPTLPLLAAQTHAPLSRISWLFVARSIGSLLGALLLGRLYDRLAGHRVLACALLAAALVLVLTPALTRLWLLLPLLLLLGAASATINVGGNTLTVRAHGQQAGPHLNAIHFAFGLGGLLAPLLAKQFAAQPNALAWTYGALALLTLPISLLFFYKPSPPQVAQTPQHATTTAPLRLIALLVLFMFVEVGAEGSISGWLFSYALARGASTALAFDLNSAFWAAFTFGRLLSIPVALRFNTRTLLVLHLACWALLAAVLLTPLPTAVSLWLGAVGMGVAMSPIFPATLALAQSVLQVSGKVTGWILVGAASGGMFWPWLIGQFFETRGPQALIWVVLFDIVAALATLSILLSQAARAEQPTVTTTLTTEEGHVCEQ